MENLRDQNVDEPRNVGKPRNVGESVPDENPYYEGARALRRSQCLELSFDGMEVAN